MPPEILSPTRPAARWHERTPFIVLLLLLAAVFPYLNTLDAPWYFDDSNNIYENPLVRDLPRALRGVLQERGVAMLSFALNHRLGGVDPTGYHLVNIAIHAGCVVAVWLLLCRLFADRRRWPLIGALLFAVHPLQTQAVTYMVQRMTCLSALFFIGAVSAYLAHLDDSGWRRRTVYGLALCSGALAVLTKENTAVLPVVLLLAERYFRPGRNWRTQLTALAPFCLAPLWKVAEMLVLPHWRGDVAASLQHAGQLQETLSVTPLHYLFTEFSVIYYYLRLLLWPVGQVLDYGWPVVDRLLTVTNLAALAGLVLLWLAAWRLRVRRPLLSFGIAWFFLALGVESSIIPLDPIFEHRLYLPMVGFVLVALDLLRELPWRWVRFAVAIVLPALAILTWQRNALWGDHVTFLEDNLSQRPGNVRVMVMLGNAYAENGRTEEGQRLLEQAMRLSDQYDFAYTGIGKILIDQGRGDEAIPTLLRGVERFPRSVKLHEYLGIAFGQVGDTERALSHFRQALQLDPDDASLYTNIGVVYSWRGDQRQAAEYFERSISLAPDSEKALFNYASTLFELGDRAKAFDLLRRVTAINPANADAHYGVGTLALEIGRREEAVAARDALRRLGDDRVGDLDRLLGANR